MMDVSFVGDALAALAAGLIVGISPDFRIPPQQTVPNAEEVTEEDPSEGRALIRTIKVRFQRKCYSQDFCDYSQSFLKVV